MPFKIVAEQESFKLTTASNGLPIADVIKLGSMHYAVCCPLCGMLHEVGQVITQGAIFAPKCLLKTTHPQTYAKWLKRFPDTAQYSQIVLKQRGVDLYPDVTVITTAQPERLAA